MQAKVLGVDTTRTRSDTSATRHTMDTNVVRRKLDINDDTHWSLPAQGRCIARFPLCVVLKPYCFILVCSGAGKLPFHVHGATPVVASKFSGFSFLEGMETREQNIIMVRGWVVFCPARPPPTRNK